MDKHIERCYTQLNKLSAYGDNNNPCYTLRLGSHLRQIFQMSEDVADNFVSELVRGN